MFTLMLERERERERERELYVSAASSDIRTSWLRYAEVSKETYDKAKETY